MISLQQVTYREDTRVILDAVSVQLHARRIAVIGANGSGKSTFARILNGLIVPSEGTVTVNGLDTRVSGAELRRRVGFVFQNPDIQFVFPTVEEDLAFGLRNLGFDKMQIRQRVSQVLERYGLLAVRHQAVHTLSGGEKQLLCIAAVLVMQPETIVFDEPTTLLDLANTRLIDRTIAGLSQQTIVITHDLDYAANCEQVLLLEHGKVLALGPPAEVIAEYLQGIEAGGRESQV